VAVKFPSDCLQVLECLPNCSLIIICVMVLVFPSIKLSLSYIASKTVVSPARSSEFSCSGIRPSLSKWEENTTFELEGSEDMLVRKARML
jgi:hypothetical protein